MMVKRCALFMVCFLLTGCFLWNETPVEDSTEAAVLIADATDNEVVEDATVLQEVMENGDRVNSEQYTGPLFSTVSLTGESIDERYFQSRNITIVNFWATWCGPCVYEMPSLAMLYENYADEGVGILGVMIDDDTEAALALIDKCGIAFPIIPASGTLAEMATGFRYVPTTVFFDKSGRQIGEEHVGSMDYGEWQSLVDSLLRQLS